MEEADEAGNLRGKSNSFELYSLISNNKISNRRHHTTIRLCVYLRKSHLNKKFAFGMLVLRKESDYINIWNRLG